MKYFFQLFFPIIFIFLINACHSDGTETGNPIQPPSYPAAENIIASLEVSICEKIQTCFETKINLCTEKLDVSPNLTWKIGINNTQLYPSLNAVYRASVASPASVHLSTGETSTCMQAIKAAPCGSELVSKSYNPIYPNSFENTYSLFMISPSCQKIATETL